MSPEDGRSSREPSPAGGASSAGSRVPPRGVLTHRSVRPPVDSDDPRTIRTVAVTAGDVVAALEANERGRRDGRTVLRITPPFSGRMRARIHVEQGLAYDDPVPVHVPPGDLVADPPPFPSPDETEDELRSDPGVEYTRERHRERHTRAVEGWREAVRDAIVERAALPLAGGPHPVEVAVLG